MTGSRPQFPQDPDEFMRGGQAKRIRTAVDTAGGVATPDTTDFTPTPGFRPQGPPRIPSPDEFMQGAELPQGKFDRHKMMPRQVALPPEESGLPAWLMAILKSLHEGAKDMGQAGKYAFTSYTPGGLAGMNLDSPFGKDILDATQGDLAAAKRLQSGQKGMAMIGSTVAAEAATAGLTAGMIAKGIAPTTLKRFGAWLGAQEVGAVSYGSVAPLDEGKTRSEEIKDDMIQFPIMGAAFHGAGKAGGYILGKIFRGFKNLDPEVAAAAKEMGKQEADKVAKRTVEIINEVGDVPPSMEVDVHANAFAQAVNESRTRRAATATARIVQEKLPPGEPDVSVIEGSKGPPRLPPGEPPPTGGAPADIPPRISPEGGGASMEPPVATTEADLAAARDDPAYVGTREYFRDQIGALVKEASVLRNKVLGGELRQKYGPNWGSSEEAQASTARMKEIKSEVASLEKQVQAADPYRRVRGTKLPYTNPYEQGLPPVSKETLGPISEDQFQQEIGAITPTTPKVDPLAEAQARVEAARTTPFPEGPPTPEGYVPRVAKPAGLEIPDSPRKMLPESKVVDEKGNLRKMFHGTQAVYHGVDVGKTDPLALYGRGFYTTSDPVVASGYAGKEGEIPQSLVIKQLKEKLSKAMKAGDQDEISRLVGQIGAVHETVPQPSPNIRPVYLDLRNPIDMDKPVPDATIQALGLDTKLLDSKLGDDVFRALESKLAVDPEFQKASAGMVPAERAKLRSDMVVERLKSVGYDGVVHEGGHITGGVKHQVAIAWDASQVHTPWELELSHAMLEHTQNPSVITQAALEDALAEAIAEETHPTEIMDPRMRAEGLEDVTTNPVLPTDPPAQEVVRGMNPKIAELSEMGVVGPDALLNKATAMIDADLATGGKGMKLSKAFEEAAKSDPLNAPDLMSLSKIAKGFEEEHTPPLSSIGDLESDPARGAEARGEWHTQSEEQLNGWSEILRRFLESDSGRITANQAVRIGATALSGYSFYRAEQTDDPRAQKLWGTVGGLLALAAITPGAGTKKWLLDSRFPYQLVKAFDLDRVVSSGTREAMDQWRAMKSQGNTFTKNMENILRPLFKEERHWKAGMYSIDEGPAAPEWGSLSPEQQREVSSQAMLNNSIISQLVGIGAVTPENARADFIKKMFKDRETGRLWYSQWESQPTPAARNAFGTVREAEKWATRYNRKGPEMDLTKVQGNYTAEAVRIIANTKMQDAFKRTHMLVPYDELTVLSQSPTMSPRLKFRQVEVPGLGGKMMATDEVATALERAHGALYSGNTAEYLRTLDYTRGLMMRGIMLWPWEHGVNVMRGAFALNFNASLYREWLGKVKAADPALMEISKYTNLFHRPDFGPQGVQFVDEALAKIGAALPTLKKLGEWSGGKHAAAERALWDRWVPAMGAAAWSKYMLNWTKQTGGKFLIGSPEYIAAATKAGEFADKSMGKIPELTQHPTVSYMLRQMWFSPQWTRQRIAITAHAMGELRQIATGEMNPKDANYLGLKMRSVLVGAVGTAVFSYLMSGKPPQFNPNTNKFYARTGVKDDRGREQGVDMTGWMQDDIKLFNDPLSFYRDRMNPMIREGVKQVNGRDVFGNPIQGMERIESLMSSFGPGGAAVDIGAGVMGSLLTGKAPSKAEVWRGVSEVGAVGNISALPTVRDLAVNKMAAKQLQRNGLPDNRDDVNELGRIMKQNKAMSGDYDGENVKNWLSYRRRSYAKKHHISWLWEEGKKVVRDLSK